MSAYDGAVVDLDGTVYRGEQAIDGSAAGVAALRDAGVEPVFLTNDSTVSPETVVDRLSACGIPARPDEVVTAGTLAAEYVARTHPGTTVLAIGAPSLREALADRQLSLTATPDRADVLVVGLDPDLSVETLTTAGRAARRVDAYVATNPDPTKPDDDGLVPETGSLLGAIERMTGREPDVIAGKPSELAADVATGRLDAAPANCLQVGDNPDTDVRMGRAAGMTTVLVRSGLAATASPSDPAVEPDYVLDSLAQIDRVLADGSSSRP